MNEYGCYRCSDWSCFKQCLDGSRFEGERDSVMRVIRTGEARVLYPVRQAVRIEARVVVFGYLSMNFENDN